MANNYFQFKQFTVWQQHCAMKVTTDGCLFGGWAAAKIVDSGQMTDDSLAPTNSNQPSTVNRQLSSLLDIGTGTGLLSLMLAQKTSLTIDAVEIDPAAAEQARQNFVASPWTDRLQVITGDITQVQLGQLYHTIISNPPFFENQLASPDAGRQKALHAAALSLSALFTAATQWLHPQGTVFLLLPAYRDAELKKLAHQNGLYLQAITWVKQTPRHEPFRMMVQLGRHISPLQEDWLIIREADQQYSTGFVDLLRDYYLEM
jgi:tRNA1Val (adenine37-N6)-methyltransferase